MCIRDRTKDDAYGQFLDDLDDNHPLRGFLPDAPDIDDTPTGTFDGGPFAFRAVVEARIFF